MRWAWLMCGLAVLGLAAVGEAQTLTGETLVGALTMTQATVNCQASNGVVGSYGMAGTAAGPFPGTFTEQGSITLLSPTMLRLNASFTIFSGTTIVTGTKDAVLVGTCSLTSFGSQEISGT